MARAVLAIVTLAFLVGFPGCLDDRGPAAAGAPDAQAAEPIAPPPEDYSFKDQEASRQAIERTWEWRVEAPAEAMEVHFSLLAGEEGFYAGDFQYWFDGVGTSQSGGWTSDSGASITIGPGSNPGTRFDYAGSAGQGDYRLRVKAEGVEQADLCLCDYSITIDVAY